MLRFNARIDILSYFPLDTLGEYQIEANISDATAMFFSGDAKVGDLIYINGTDSGNPLLMEYEVIEVVDNSAPPISILNIKFLNPIEIGPFDPIGSEGVIGTANPGGLIQIPDPSVQGITDIFANAIRNYQIDVENLADNVNSFANKVTEILPTNGINTEWDSSFAISSNLSIYLNGLKLLEGNDFSWYGNRIILPTAPFSEDNLVIEYIRK